jgi:hypothetical protein
MDAEDVSTCDFFLAKKNSIANFPPIALARSLCRRSVRLLQHTIITYVFLFFILCSNFYAAAAFFFCGALWSRAFFCRFFFSLLLQKNINKIP